MDVFVTLWRFHNRAWQPQRQDRLPKTSGALWIPRGALTNQRCSLATECGIMEIRLGRTSTQPIWIHITHDSYISSSELYLGNIYIIFYFPKIMEERIWTCCFQYSVNQQKYRSNFIHENCIFHIFILSEKWVFYVLLSKFRGVKCEHNVTSGARPTKHISIEFEIRWKFRTL